MQRYLLIPDHRAALLLGVLLSCACDGGCTRAQEIPDPAGETSATEVVRDDEAVKSPPGQHSQVEMGSVEIRKSGALSYVVAREGFPSFDEWNAAHGRRHTVIKRGGKVGVKVLAYGEGSLPPLLGLRDGDFILRVNGVGLDSVDGFQAAIANIRTASEVRVVVERDGVEIVLDYQVLDSLPTATGKTP